MKLYVCLSLQNISSMIQHPWSMNKDQKKRNLGVRRRLFYRKPSNPGQHFRCVQGFSLFFILTCSKLNNERRRKTAKDRMEWTNDFGPMILFYATSSAENSHHVSKAGALRFHLLNYNILLRFVVLFCVFLCVCRPASSDLLELYKDCVLFTAGAGCQKRFKHATKVQSRY